MIGLGMVKTAPELTPEQKDQLVRSVRSSMWLSGLEPLPYDESMALLEKVLLEPPLELGERSC